MRILNMIGAISLALGLTVSHATADVVGASVSPASSVDGMTTEEMDFLFGEQASSLGDLDLTTMSWNEASAVEGEFPFVAWFAQGATMALGGLVATTVWNYFTGGSSAGTTTGSSGRGGGGGGGGGGRDSSSSHHELRR